MLVPLVKLKIGESVNFFLHVDGHIRGLYRDVDPIEQAQVPDTSFELFDLLAAVGRGQRSRKQEPNRAVLGADQSIDFQVSDGSGPLPFPVLVL